MIFKKPEAPTYDYTWQEAAGKVFGDEILFNDCGRGVVSEHTLPGMISYGEKFYHYRSESRVIMGKYRNVEFTYYGCLRAVKDESEMQKKEFCGSPAMQLVLHNMTYSSQKIACSRSAGNFKEKKKEGWLDNGSIRKFITVWSEKWKLSEKERKFIELFDFWLWTRGDEWEHKIFRSDNVYFGDMDTFLLYERPQANGFLPDPMKEFETLRDTLDILTRWKWE